MAKPMCQTHCGGWSQDWGRDAHVCQSVAYHPGIHHCKCGFEWEHDRRRKVSDWPMRVVLGGMVISALMLFTLVVSALWR